MVSPGLLAQFEHTTREAARRTMYTKRRDGSSRPLGGYNVVLVGDWWRLPPIPESGALFRPSEPGMREGAKAMSRMSWTKGTDSITHLWEITGWSGLATRGSAMC